MPILGTADGIWANLWAKKYVMQKKPSKIILNTYIRDASSNNKIDFFWINKNLTKNVRYVARMKKQKFYLLKMCL